MDVLDEKVVVEVGRTLVATLAPQQMPLFGPVSEAYFKNPKGAATRGRAKDDILGFGAADAELLIPVVLSALTYVGQFLADEVGKSLTAATASLIKDQVKRLLRREPAEVTLQPAQLAEVRRIALTTAQQFRLSDAKAAQLADAIVGQLAIGHAS